MAKPKLCRGYVPLLCAASLLANATCSFSASDLRYSHPAIPLVQICDKPLDVPDNVNLWGFNYATKELVTDPVELRLFDTADAFFEYNAGAPLSSASHMPSEYGLTCPKLPAVYTSWSALPSSSELFRSKEPCPVAEGAVRPDPRWLGAMGNPGCIPALKKPQVRIPVCARPASVAAKVDEWAQGTGDKSVLTTNAKVFAEAVAKVELVFVFDENAAPESVCWFVEDPATLPCPGKPPARPCKVARESGLLQMMTAITSVQAETSGKGKSTGDGNRKMTGDGHGKTTETSSPNGKGPSLSFTERLAHNLAILGALAASDTSGNLKDPNGSRYGIPQGKNVGGPDLLPLQAAAGVFAIIGIPFKNPKEFIKSVQRALGERKVAGIIDPKVLTKEMAEQLAKEPEQEAVRKAIDGLKKGDDKAFEALESFGLAMAPSLREASVVLPYSRAKVFTKGWGNELQAHHLLEAAMAKDSLDMAKGAIDDLPAIILSEAEHQAITNRLAAARTKLLGSKDAVPNKQQLWAIYKDVYQDTPAWLEAIEAYFK